MSATKEVLYAFVGIGDLAAEQARKAQSTLATFDPSKLKEVKLDSVRQRLEKSGGEVIVNAASAYGSLVERGQKTVTTIKKAGATRKAVAQTKTARSQTKAAVTSAKKAAASTVEAGKKAATAV